ncbi:MAG: hypothetical protein M1581_04075 [Candidatus Thermoplasmatota archaeon]|nr:hypothetical protein [Candidatus Thermoplasmatota archaeon]
MKQIMRIIMVIVIAAGISVPLAYYAINTNSNSNTVNIASFIPYNSEIAVRLNLNGSSYYFAALNGSYGGIVPLSTSSLDSAVSGISTGSNVTAAPNITINYYETYDGFDVYTITNLSNGNLTSNLQNVYTIQNNPLEILKLIEFTNSTIYFTSLSANNILLGNLNFINMSLSFHKKGYSYAGFNDLFPDENISFVIGNASKPLGSMNGFINDSSTYINMHVNASSLLNHTKQIHSILNLTGVPSTFNITNTSISISLKIGLKQYEQAFTILKDLETMKTSILGA